MNTAVITSPPQKAKSPRLQDEFAAYLRLRNYSPATIRSYVNDVLDFVIFSGKRDPRTLGREDVRLFLTHLAVKRNVAWKTQNQSPLDK
jgi:site-specific recombinase XerD